MPLAGRRPYEIGYRMNENARPVIMNWSLRTPEGAW
jgi:hypothetical protein